MTTMMESYLARLLPPDEWDRLGIPRENLPADPDATVIMVVEDADGRIVGRWMAYTVVTLEGLFIEPRHRKHPGVAARLFQAMTAELMGRNVPMAFTLITDEAVARLGERHGLTRLPGQLWALDLRRLVEAGVDALLHPPVSDNEGG